MTPRVEKAKLTGKFPYCCGNCECMNILEQFAWNLKNCQTDDSTETIIDAFNCAMKKKDYLKGF